MRARRFDEKISLNANSANPLEDRERHSGWYIGGGVDMAVSHGWTIGLEYRHYEFDDATSIGDADARGRPGLSPACQPAPTSPPIS